MLENKVFAFQKNAMYSRFSRDYYKENVFRIGFTVVINNSELLELLYIFLKKKRKESASGQIPVIFYHIIDYFAFFSVIFWRYIATSSSAA